MKIPIVFKTPDAVDFAIDEAFPMRKIVKDEFVDLVEDSDEFREVFDKRKELKSKIYNLIKYGEYLIVYYDVEKNCLVFY